MPLNAVKSSGLFGQLVQLWHWWVDELISVWKDLPFRSTTGDAVSLIHLRQSEVLIDVQVGGTGERYIEEKSFEALSAEDFAQLIELTASTKLKILLGEPDVYVTTVKLPRLTAAQTEAAVELQMGIIAPIRPELLRWVVPAVERDGRHLRVTVAMAKQSRLEHIQATLGANGIDSATIGPVAWPTSAFVVANSWAPGLATAARSPWLILSLLALASIPFTTIIGSSILAARADSRAAAMQDTAKQNRTAIKTAIEMEERRRATQPFFAQADAATILNELARALPASDWLRSVERAPNGSLTFIVSTRDEAALDTALRDGNLFAGLHVTDAATGADGTTDVTYQTDEP